MLRNLEVKTIIKTTHTIDFDIKDKKGESYRYQFQKEEAAIVLGVFEGAISLEACESIKGSSVSLRAFLAICHLENLPSLSKEQKNQLKSFVRGELKQSSQKMTSEVTEEESPDSLDEKVKLLSGRKVASERPSKMCVADKMSIEAILKLFDYDYRPMTDVTFFYDIIDIKFGVSLFRKNDVNVEQSLLRILEVLSTFPQSTFSLDFSWHPLPDETIKKLIKFILDQKINIYAFSLKNPTPASCQSICDLIQGTAIKVLSVSCEPSFLMEIDHALRPTICKSDTLLEVDFNDDNHLLSRTRIDDHLTLNRARSDARFASRADYAADSQEKLIAELKAENKRLTDTIEKLDATHEEICRANEKLEAELQAKSSESRLQQEVGKNQKSGFFDRRRKDIEVIQSTIEECKRNGQTVAGVLSSFVKDERYDDAIQFIQAGKLSTRTSLTSLKNKK